MKKLIPDGKAIKELREQLVRLSTQKEFANALAISVRQLRKIENENASISVIMCERLARLLGVDTARVTLRQSSAPSGAAPTAAERPLADDDVEQLVPRHDWDTATATADDGELFREASSSDDLTCAIETPLNEETSAYAREFVELLTDLTWSRRDIREEISPAAEIATRRRLRQLIVLLRGSDIWIYVTSVLRRLPERYDLAPEGEPVRYSFRLVLALAPRGADGETTTKVAIDHGRPFMLPSWNASMNSQTVTSC